MHARQRSGMRPTCLSSASVSSACAAWPRSPSRQTPRTRATPWGMGPQAVPWPRSSWKRNVHRRSMRMRSSTTYEGPREPHQRLEAGVGGAGKPAGADGPEPGGHTWTTKSCCCITACHKSRGGSSRKRKMSTRLRPCWRRVATLGFWGILTR